jgi:S-DNA-T family DNA segregation ATPase FtsK/SpoIIIE
MTRTPDAVPGDGSPGTEMEPKVFEAELVDRGVATALARSAPTRLESRWRVLRTVTGRAARRMWQAERGVQVRSVLGYRLRKVPADVLRLVWFVLRGHWRWLVKLWNWATYADLRSDARSARLAGDPEARREAQELIRSDARARWARVGIVLRRLVITAKVLAPVAVVLWAVDAWMDRADMWEWLSTVYTVLDTTWTVLGVILTVFAVVGPMVWMVAAAFEGRDRTPGAGWLTQPDRDREGSWVDERMISQALAHLGIAPLNQHVKNGGQLVYTVPARRDGDGTFAQVRLPLGVTADMITDRRDRLAANLGRSKLETWPTEADEAGLLDLWVADKGKLGGGAGEWPLVCDGQVDVFEGVPFGLTQRGLIINAPLIEANWLIGGRPGQGKTSAMRTLLLGAGLDPTAELWVFVMGESPDFDPLTPRLARYRMGMDDQVAEATVTALEELLEEMERRGRVLGDQPGRPPKVSRKLADKARLGLHPLVIAIDECHELFQHRTYGRRAEEAAVRLIKRGRKYGIILLLATQSPAKDSIPKEITRNVSCGIAFAVADHYANDGLLGSGKYRAGIRATDLRMKTDRGTCVAVGVTDNPFELVRTFYIPFEDGTDHVTPIVARSLAILADAGRAIEPPDRPPEIVAAPVDHLADIATVLGDEPRLRTQVVLTRLAEHNPDTYEGWTFTDLSTALAEHGVTPRKSDGIKVIRTVDVVRALAERDREADRDPSGTQGDLPDPSLPPTPWVDQHKPALGTPTPTSATSPKTPRNRTSETPRMASLPDPDGGGRHG